MNFSDKYLFIVYYTLCSDKDFEYKTFIKSQTREDAKRIFNKKIKKVFPDFKIKGVRIFKINRFSYRGSSLSDKQWETLKNISYPNGKNTLARFLKDSWFKKTKSKNRNADGTFKVGNTPWNKNFKIKFFKKNPKGLFTKPRDPQGRFLKGCQGLMCGIKNEYTTGIFNSKQL